MRRRPCRPTDRSVVVRSWSRMVAHPSPSIDVSVDGDAPVMRLTGEFDLSTRAALEQQLESLQTADDRPATVVPDLTGTTFIDSTVVNALVAAHRNGLDFIIRGSSGMPRRALEVLAIPDLFVFEPEK